ncbi:hypothetical protein HID58_033382, partial [Brassica napus]
DCEKIIAMNIFRKKATPKDALRTSKREMSVATRGTYRYRARDFISSAGGGDKDFSTSTCKIEATDYKLTGKPCSNQRCNDSHTGMALYASTSISSGMKGATKAMVAMNKIEMMSEAIDETLDKDEAEEETEDLTNQVLDEIGVGVASQLSSAPKGRIATKTAAPPPPATTTNSNSSESSEVDELEKRLASLRRI